MLINFVDATNDANH